MTVFLKESKELTPENHWVIHALYRDGKLQLEKRTEPGASMFGYVIVPGGSIKVGETQEEAMLREAGEEYGVIPLVYKKLGIVYNRSSSGSLDFRHIYIVTEWEGELKNLENRNEHIEATLEEARELCKHPISQQTLNLIEKELSGQNT